jgi:hypothetical protein
LRPYSARVWVHRAEHLDVAYRVEPEALGDSLPNNRHEFPYSFFRVRRINEVKVSGFDRGEIRHHAV